MLSACFHYDETGTTRRNKWLCYFSFLKLINSAFEQLPGKDILCVWNSTHLGRQSV